MSVWDDMAMDAGYRGDEAAQVAQMIEREERERADQGACPWCGEWGPSGDHCLCEGARIARVGDLVATVIEVAWSDGLRHRFERQDDDTWTLTLGGIPEVGPRIVGYRRGDLERVLGRAFDGTREGCAGD